jgi:hypothetical protein
MINLWRDLYSFNPVPTIYLTVTAAIFFPCLFVGLRMYPGEHINVHRFMWPEDEKMDRNDIIFGWGLCLGLLWGPALAIYALVGLVKGLQFITRIGKRRPHAIVPARFDVHGRVVAAEEEWTEKKEDPYQIAAQREVDAIVTVDHDNDV